MKNSLWPKFISDPLICPVGVSLKQQFEFTERCIKEIENICKPDAYNLVAYKHLGDVFYALGLKDIFEEVYKSPIHYIILPQHEFLTKLWRIENYSLYPLDKIVKENKKFITSFFGDLEPSRAELDLKLDGPYMMTVFSSIPQKGKPFLMENIFNHLFDYPYYWCFKWASNLGIEEEFRFTIPKGKLSLSRHAFQIAKELGGFERIILLAPEAQTSVELPTDWWMSISAELTKRGYSIIVNSSRIRIPNTVSSFDVELSLEDVVAIGLRCHAIFSLRSGLADSLIAAGSRLYVINPAMLRREQYSLERPFESPTGVNEIQICNWKVSDCDFEGVNIGSLLRSYVKSCKMQYMKELFLSIFNRRKHREKYNYLRKIAGRPKRSSDNNIMNPYVEKNRFIRTPFLYKELSCADNHVKLRFFLLGLINVKETLNGLKIKICGVPFYSRTLSEYQVTKLFGLTVQKKQRRAVFFKYLKNGIHKASEEIYGQGIKADHVFIIRHNIGESVIYLSEYKRWINAIGAERPILFVWRERDISLVRLFLDDLHAVRYIGLSQSDINCFLKDEITDFNGCKIHVPTFEIAKTLRLQYQSNSKINFVDLILSSMSLDKWGCPNLPRIQALTEKRATWMLNHLNITRPFVLICPEASSLCNLSNFFWIQLASRLEDCGFEVIVNARNGQWNEDKKLNCIKNCLPDIDVLFSIAKRAERIVSIASGLGVLLSLSGRPLDLIYTDLKGNHQDIGGFSAKFCQQVYSVYHIPSVEKNLVTEYILDNEEKILEQIMQRICCTTA